MFSIVWRWFCAAALAWFVGASLTALSASTMAWTGSLSILAVTCLVGFIATMTVLVLLPALFLAFITSGQDRSPMIRSLSFCVLLALTIMLGVASIDAEHWFLSALPHRYRLEDHDVLELLAWKGSLREGEVISQQEWPATIAKLQPSNVRFGDQTLWIDLGGGFLHFGAAVCDDTAGLPEQPDRRRVVDSRHLFYWVEGE